MLWSPDGSHRLLHTYLYQVWEEPKNLQMSIVFSDNFDSGVLMGWGSPNTLETVNFWGTGGSYAEGCSTQSQQSRKIMSAPIPNHGSMRMQLACFVDPSLDLPSSDGLLAFAVQDFNSGDNFNRFQMLVYLLHSGAFRVRLKKDNTSDLVFVDTAAGLYPTDGTQFGLQIRFIVNTTSTIVFTVNNTDVATINYTRDLAFDANQWDDFFIYGTRQPGSGAFPIVSIAVVDDFEMDDSNAKITWNAGDAAQLDPNRVCLFPPLGQTIDSVTVDCLTHELIVVGGDFTDGVEVTLTGPGGVSEDFTIVSQTLTQIVLGSLDPAFVDGTSYCVTIGSSTTLCATLTCESSFPTLGPASWRLHRFDLKPRQEQSS